MRSSDFHRAVGLCALLFALAVPAQQAVQGFATERLYASAPGAGWLVMDDLGMHGGLGGALALTLGYANSPFHVGEGAQRLTVVRDQAVADIGAAITYDGWRLYLDLASPIVTLGQSGTVGASSFTAPSVDLSSHPDTVSDVRVGVDARLLGEATSPFRLGGSVQAYFPNGSRGDYDTDGTFRGMARLLAAGEAGAFSYAAQLGVHVRPLDEAPAPGGPRGSELLFGVAAGRRFYAGPDRVLVLGPEVYGETAFRGFFGRETTGIEGLVTARLEGTGPGLELRVKAGAGGGLDPNFGAPAWRVVVAVELFSAGKPFP